METWYKINFLAQLGAAMKFFQDFADLHVLCGNLSKDAVLVLDDRGYQITTYYASPGAFAIARHLILANGGQPCPTPARKDVTLSVGDVNELDRLLPAFYCIQRKPPDAGNV